MGRYPPWCYQPCGTPIGYLGRLILLASRFLRLFSRFLQEEGGSNGSTRVSPGVKWPR